MPALKFLFIAAWLALLPEPGFSQNYPFIKYTPKDGLVSNRVQNFYQDTRGRIFFMTANGLSVFDGARFLNYGVTDGLASPVVNDMLELAPDSFLIATNTHALNVLVRGSMKPLPTANGFCPVINKFYQDKEKRIYVASDQGLYRFDKNIFNPVFFELYGNPVPSLVDIQELGEYMLLRRLHISQAYSDLVLIHKKTLRSQPVAVKGHVSSVLAIQEDQSLLMIVDQKLVSFHLEAAEKGALVPGKLPHRFHAVKDLRLSKLIADRNHQIWCMTNNTVIRLRENSNPQVFDRTNGLDVNNISSIVVDRENVLWVLTDGIGIYKLVSRNIEILPPDAFEFVEDRWGSTWKLHASGNELSCFREGRNRNWRLKGEVQFKGLAVRKNSVLLLTYHSIYEAKPQPETERLSLKKLYEDSAGSLNIARTVIGYNDEVYIPGKFLTVVNNNNQVRNILFPAYVDQVSLDTRQQLWAVTREGDLLCYTINHMDSADPLSLKFARRIPIASPRSLVVDRTGKLWIGTRYSGIYRLEYIKDSLAITGHWTAGEGLSDNFIYYLSCDSNHVIWAGTQGGLDKIYGPDARVESVSRNNNIYQVIHKIIVDRDNHIWAQGIGSTIRVMNEKGPASDYQPQVQMIRMISGDKNLGLLPDHTAFPSGTRELTIEVAAPSFIDEKRVLYSYLLDGREKSQWSPPSPDASFRFINLQPDDYTLRIKAIFPVADYPGHEMVYRFTILPAWWQTWWFRTLVLLLVLLGLLLGIKAYYQNKLRKQKLAFEKEHAVQQERTRIAMEMHDDLGSGLTVIRYLAGGLSAGTLPFMKENALKIESSARQLVDNMNDIIWTIKSDNNSLSDVLGYIRKQAADVLENVGIDYRFDFPNQTSDILLKNEQKRDLLLISKEAVHNIIKHSGATNVSITAREEGAYLHFSFADNGKGMGKTALNSNGNGLKNIRQRVKKMGGEVEIVSRDGTEVIFRIPLT